MEDIGYMTVIPEPVPNTRSVLVATFDGPLIRGRGVCSYRCGKCGSTLFSNVEQGQLMDIVVKCFRCHAYNEAPPSS